MKMSVDQALRKAATLARSGQVDDAETILRDVLRTFPANKRAAESLDALIKSPAEQGAGTPPSAAGEATPASADLRPLFDLIEANKLREAADFGAGLVARYPDDARLFSVFGGVNARLGRFAIALECFDRAIAGKPDMINAHSHRGIVLRELGRLPEALACFERASDLAPLRADLHNNRGVILQDLKRQEEAIAAFDAALALGADLMDVHVNRGNALRELDRPEDALASYDAALQLDTGLFGAHYNRGLILKGLGRLEEALASLDEALTLNPGESDAYNSRGTVLQDLGRFDDALNAYENALRFRPAFAEALNNRAVLLKNLGRLDESLASFDEAIRLDPRMTRVWYNRGLAHQDSRRTLKAIEDFERTLQLDPGHQPALVQLLHQKAQLCDWSESPTQPVVDLLRLGIEGRAVSTFALLAIDGDPGRQLARAKLWARTKLPSASPPLPRPGARPARLRIGYYSADFHDHATMRLALRLFELHDRDRFELHAFSFGPDKHDGLRARIHSAFDRFHDVANSDDKGIADLSRELSIHVAVDLKGYTRDARPGIFARRAAPLQMSFLGYPGSMGADFIDYIVADGVVIPRGLEAAYSEKVIRLPHTYQPNDDTRPIDDIHFMRSDLGLPENGFVFCCFNNTFKISPAEFDVWMRLLHQVDGSVLWLMAQSDLAIDNLRREAAVRGVDPARLIFAPRMALPQHLARHRCADLFLDTFTYNAHTTASDALWAGLPMVTRPGNSFASRVGASLLEAVGMNELIARDVAEYEALALSLANDSRRMAAIKAKLTAQLPSAPLFDSKAFAVAIECAYDVAYARCAAGLPADHLDIAEKPNQS